MISVSCVILDLWIKYKIAYIYGFPTYSLGTSLILNLYEACILKYWETVIISVGSDGELCGGAVDYESVNN